MSEEESKPEDKRMLVFHATEKRCPNCELTLLDIEVIEQRCFVCGWSAKTDERGRK